MPKIAVLILRYFLNMNCWTVSGSRTANRPDRTDGTCLEMYSKPQRQPRVTGIYSLKHHMARKIASPYTVADGGENIEDGQYRASSIVSDMGEEVDFLLGVSPGVQRRSG